MKKIILIAGILVAFTMCFSTAKAATDEEIEQAIQDGIAWLVAQQEGDGSWPAFWEDVATTGLAVLKLEHRAYELGYDSPFDPAYPYHQNVEDGLNYLFDATATRLLTTTITPQDHTGGASGTVDDPDYNGNRLGVYAHGSGYPFDVYDTGIVLAAISASGTPNRVVNVPGSVVDGWTYDSVAQDMAEWLAWAQSDFDYAVIGMGEGGWSYGALDNDDQMGSYGPDNSNSGYATLGLAYAKDFGCVIPQWVKTELNAYINDIQDPVDGDANGYDGGSWYDAPVGGSGIPPNILKTGNLIFEMALLGDIPTTPRVVDALDYLARHWADASGANQPPGWVGRPAQYQTMFATMKGLEYMGIDTFDSIDWYLDFSDTIVSQQIPQDDPDPNIRGSWQTSSGRGNPTIITTWALLTLERVAPLPPGVSIDIKPQSCPNPFNTKSKGVLPVAILGTEDFDVSTVDPATVLLEGVTPLRWDFEDVSTPVEPGDDTCECTTEGADGYMDMTLKFDRQEIFAALEPVSDGEMRVLTLTGMTYDSTDIKGQDCVRIIHKVKSKLSTEIADGFSLGKNYPNPFNPETDISFSLPERTQVSLIIYNILGERVKTLVNAELDAGTHAIHWNGRDDAGNAVASGIYFYRLKTESFDQTRKMVLMK